MTDMRFKNIVDEIKPCNFLADIGCDHGYVTQLALKNGKCKRAFISDISKPCLEKAVALLDEYIQKGVVLYSVGDGMANIPKGVDSVVIAGMGGEEIVKILSTAPYLPQNLYLQPMKNARKVREYLLNNNFGILKDYTFGDDKYYDYIIASYGAKIDEYTALQLEFGKDNLLNPTPAFIKRVDSELAKITIALQQVEKEQTLKELQERIALLRGIKDVKN